MTHFRDTDEAHSEPLIGDPKYSITHDGIEWVAVENWEWNARHDGRFGEVRYEKRNLFHIEVSRARPGGMPAITSCYNPDFLAARDGAIALATALIKRDLQWLYSHGYDQYGERA